MMHVTVTVSLKQSVLDSPGKAIENALHQLGFSEATDVRVSKSITFTMEAASPQVAETRVRQMCDQLLANTVMEVYHISILSE